MRKLSEFGVGLQFECWENFVQQHQWTNKPSILSYYEIDGGVRGNIEKNVTQICNAIFLFIEENYSERLTDGFSNLTKQIEKAFVADQYTSHGKDIALIMYIIESLDFNDLKNLSVPSINDATDLIIEMLEKEATINDFGQVLNEFIGLNTGMPELDSNLLISSTAMIV